MERCKKCDHYIIPQIGYCVICDPKKSQNSQGINRQIILTIDLSYSMYGQRLEDAKQAAIAFVNTIDTANCSISVSGFADLYQVFCQSTNDKTKLRTAISRLEIELLGIGNDNVPLEDAYNAFNTSKNKCLMIVVTDGEWYNEDRAILMSDKYKEEGIDIFAYGIGGANLGFLKRIATCDESALKTSSGEMSGNFKSIAETINKTGSFVNRSI